MYVEIFSSQTVWAVILVIMYVEIFSSQTVWAVILVIMYVEIFSNQTGGAVILVIMYVEIFSSQTVWVVILVIMYVEIFKTEVIVFIGPIFFNITVSSCTCELRTDLIFLWIKVSSVIQTWSAIHIKGKMSNLPINGFMNSVKISMSL
jgi:hypothetical protein